VHDPYGFGGSILLDFQSERVERETTPPGQSPGLGGINVIYIILSSVY
jgi:hypothetical protein